MLRIRSRISLSPHARAHKLTLFHTWRVAGTAAFLHYGSKNELPPVFVRNAAWGDVIGSAFAAALVVLPRNRATYLAFHAFGLCYVKRAVEPARRVRSRDQSRAAEVRAFGVRKPGLRGGSLAEIARDADATTGTLYHHFADKKTLFIAVAEEIEAEILAAIARTLPKTGERDLPGRAQRDRRDGLA